MKNEGQFGILIISLIITILIIVGFVLYIISNIQISWDKDVQILVVVGIILIVIALIFAWRVRSVNMDDHHKVQALALVGLTAIAITSLTVALNKDDLASFIAVASAAAGGIAGFIAHKAIEDNKTILSPLKDEYVELDNNLKFTLKGISTAGYALTYSMSASPNIPEGEDAKLNPISGEFSWTPKIELKPDEEKKEYTMTFKVTDSQGNTDSRVMKITVINKRGT